MKRLCVFCVFVGLTAAFGLLAISILLGFGKHAYQAAVLGLSFAMALDFTRTQNKKMLAIIVWTNVFYFLISISRCAL